MRSIVRWSAPAEPVTSAEVEAWKDRIRDAPWVQDQLAELERGWSQMDFPETKPYYGQVSVGSDGTVWLGPLELEDEGPTRLRAFTPDGVYAGSMTVRGSFRVMDSGPGWVAGVMVDENQVEYVQIYRVDLG